MRETARPYRLGLGFILWALAEMYGRDAASLLRSAINLLGIIAASFLSAGQGEDEIHELRIEGRITVTVAIKEIPGSVPSAIDKICMIKNKIQPRYFAVVHLPRLLDSGGQKRGVEVLTPFETKVRETGLEARAIR